MHSASPRAIISALFVQLIPNTTANHAIIYTNISKWKEENLIIFSLNPLDFGNRPRKLYIVINPVSGASTSASNKTWQKIQKMFQVANIHTDILSKTLLVDGDGDGDGGGGWRW